MVRGVRPVLQVPVQAALPGSHFRGMIAPNNSFKPNALRYTNNMAGRACHVVGSATHVGLTQALGASNLELKRFRSEEHTSELQSLMRNSYAVFCLKKKKSKRHSITYKSY